MISAGYGLIPATKLIKPYSATFASRVRDSIWRGKDEGDRRQRMQEWWSVLPHEVSLSDLLSSRRDSVFVIAAGASYMTAIVQDLENADAFDASGERVSVISAGSRKNGAFLPVDRRFRAVVSGTDSSLNARLLAFIARDASKHRFRRTAMAATFERLDSQLGSAVRSPGVKLTDEQVIDRIGAIKRTDPRCPRTRALRMLRDAGLSCEQDRFAALWASH